MNREEYLQKKSELTDELMETEKLIAGLYNKKKQIMAEMDRLLDQMVEEARNGRLDKEE